MRLVADTPAPLPARPALTPPATAAEAARTTASIFSLASAV